MKLFYLICLTGLIGVLACSSFTGSQVADPASRKETVVLLHGMVRSSKSMNKMEKKLTAAGYNVINHDYPSTSATIEKLSTDIFQSLEPQIDDAPVVHFVTHSLGGMILREHLENHELPNLGRVVMLAPPSQGSEVTDKLGNVFLYRWINGPAGNQLGTGTDSHPLRLKAPAFELGVIAGDRTINPILSLMIPGPDDGKVSVARVKPETCNDYRLMHVTHACMMWNRKVIRETIHFLEHGRFIPVAPDPVSRTEINNRYFAMNGSHPMRFGGYCD